MATRITPTRFFLSLLPVLCVGLWLRSSRISDTWSWPHAIPGGRTELRAIESIDGGIRWINLRGPSGGKARLHFHHVAERFDTSAPGFDTHESVTYRKSLLGFKVVQGDSRPVGAFGPMSYQVIVIPWWLVTALAAIPAILAWRWRAGVSVTSIETPAAR